MNRNVYPSGHYRWWSHSWQTSLMHEWSKANGWRVWWTPEKSAYCKRSVQLKTEQIRDLESKLTGGAKKRVNFVLVVSLLFFFKRLLVFFLFSYFEIHQRQCKFMILYVRIVYFWRRLSSLKKLEFMPTDYLSNSMRDRSWNGTPE